MDMDCHVPLLATFGCDGPSQGGDLSMGTKRVNRAPTTACQPPSPPCIPLHSVLVAWLNMGTSVFCLSTVGSSKHNPNFECPERSWIVPVKVGPARLHMLGARTHWSLWRSCSQQCSPKQDYSGVSPTWFSGSLFQVITLGTSDFQPDPWNQCSMRCRVI